MIDVDLLHDKAKNNIIKRYTRIGVFYIAGSRVQSDNDSFFESDGLIFNLAHHERKLSCISSNVFFCSGVSSNACALLMVLMCNPLFFKNI